MPPRPDGKERSYGYRVEFTKGTVLQMIMLDADNRVTFGNSLDTYHKTDTTANASK